MLARSFRLTGSSTEWGMRGAGLVRCAGRMNTDSPAPRPERWWHRHRRVVGGVGAAAATALAATWLVVVPGEAAEADGLQRFLLQYAHSICWGLIAIALAGFFWPHPLLGILQPNRWATLVFTSAYFWASLAAWVWLMIDAVAVAALKGPRYFASKTTAGPSRSS